MLAMGLTSIVMDGIIPQAATARDGCSNQRRSAQRPVSRDAHATTRAKPRRPDLVDETIDACEREAQRGLVDEAPIAHLLMHAADHDLGPAHRTRRGSMSVSFICCCVRVPPVKAGEAVIVVPRLGHLRGSKWRGFRLTMLITI
jgi:hypothetical protein